MIRLVKETDAEAIMNIQKRNYIIGNYYKIFHSIPKEVTE